MAGLPLTYVRYTCGCGEVFTGRTVAGTSLGKLPRCGDLHSKEIAWACSACRWCETWVAYQPWEEHMPLCARCALIADEMHRAGKNLAKCSPDDARRWVEREGELHFLDDMIATGWWQKVMYITLVARTAVVWIDGDDFHARYVKPLREVFK